MAWEEGPSHTCLREQEAVEGVSGGWWQPSVCSDPGSASRREADTAAYAKLLRGGVFLHTCKISVKSPKLLA